MRHVINACSKGQQHAQEYAANRQLVFSALNCSSVCMPTALIQRRKQAAAGMSVCEQAIGVETHDEDCPITAAVVAAAAALALCCSPELSDIGAPLLLLVVCMLTAIIACR
jgi:hypothetical protein